MYFKSIFLGCLSLALTSLHAQDRSGFIHATMQENHAKELFQQFPQLVDIIESKNQLSAVYIHADATHELHQKILSHGPGFIFHPDKQQAIQALDEPINKLVNVTSYTISESTLVHKAIADVNADRIEEIMLILENFGTRFHTNPKANLAVQKVKELWEELIAISGRTDIHVRVINHVNTPMKSVILTIDGNEKADEYVIVGGHLDSTAPDKTNAPGSDDNASGIATITEVIRVLLSHHFMPQRTTEFMAYAAEEVGLVGSKEIATTYKNQGKNVMAYVQFDMTNYQGSIEDIFITTDSYNNNDLNLYLIDLMETYNKTGKHALTYGYTKCNYGCSDHHSWAQKGYPTAFPFEASFSESSPYIHTSSDTFTIVGHADHAAKFSKLGLEFVIEAAKSSSKMSVTNMPLKSDAKFYNDNQFLTIQLANQSKIHAIKIVDAAGVVHLSKEYFTSSKLDIRSLKSGFYIAILTDQSGKTFTHKFRVY